MITLYHAPRSRSSRIIWLLEELDVPYEIKLTSIVYGNGTGTRAPDSYKDIHPLKKVPAIKNGDDVMYESAGICLYLTDAFPKNRIGPLPGEKSRANYVRWLFFYTGILEPASSARFRGWDKDSPSGFGNFEDVETAIAAQLEATPYITGDAFSAADTLFGSACQFFRGSLFPERKCYEEYVARLVARPAYVRAQAKENG